MLLYSNRMMFTFLSLLDLLGDALAFRIFILKIFKLLPNYGHRATDITSFEKHLESSSGHTLSLCRKRGLIGAVCLNHRIKRLVPCRCLDGHIKEPYEMSMALEARPLVQLLLLQSACTSMRRHIYD